MNIAVLISGGVDSAVVVHELVQQAQHDLQLFYIRIGMDNDEGDCSAEEDIEMCNLIAHRYGFSRSCRCIRSIGTMSWSMLCALLKLDSLLIPT